MTYSPSPSGRPRIEDRSVIVDELERRDGIRCTPGNVNDKA
jgi:hypothetical protein